VVVGKGEGGTRRGAYDADIPRPNRRAKVLEHLRNMPFAPSAQMQHVPYYEDDDEGDSDEELDVRLSGEYTWARRAQHLVKPALTSTLYALSSSERVNTQFRPRSPTPSFDELPPLRTKSYITSHAGSRRAEHAQRHPPGPHPDDLDDGCGHDRDDEPRRKRNFFGGKGLDMGRLTEPDARLVDVIRSGALAGSAAGAGAGVGRAAEWSRGVY